MAGIPTRLVYDEPTVMWRMKRADAWCHAVITPLPDGVVVAWFVNDHQLGHRDFTDWGDAIRWSDQLRAQNWVAGWRVLQTDG